MGMGRVRLSPRERHLHAGYDGRHATARQRCQVRLGVQYGGEGTRLRVHGIREPLTAVRATLRQGAWTCPHGAWETPPRFVSTARRTRSWRGHTRSPPRSATIYSQIASQRPIYLEEFDGRASNLDERDDHSRAWAVRGNDDVLPAQGALQVVHLERHMRDGLHEFGNRRTLPVPLPLD